MAESILLSERRGAVVRLTLNRPERRNALGPDLVAALTEALRSLSSEDSVRAVVLTGAGTAFCAGADLEYLEQLRSASVAENADDSRRLKTLYRALSTFPKPIVGAVDGPALAGGCGLASACDVLLASPRASFGYPEVRIGFVAAMVLVFLARQLGDRLARELLLTGRTLTAEEAREAGLVHRVLPSDRLTEEALAVAENLASGAPSSLALTKELLWHTSGLPTGSALSLAETVNVFARTTPDMQEGLSAFFAKRRPSWPGS
ncbi:MAG: enoyl-CoA hydratase/isomerase family protein [Acidobacteriota bacterium]